LTQAFSWRASFWFLAADVGVNLVLFVLFFRDTFRKERSLTYQRVLASRRRAASKRSSIVSDTAYKFGNKLKEEATVAAGEAPGASAISAETATNAQEGAEITLSFKDVNPFPPLLLILKRRNNAVTLVPSGMLRTCVLFDRSHSSVF
jgi:hypothetical protein